MNSSKIEAWRGQIRLPMPLAQWLKDRANKNFRTLNAELVEIARRAKEDEARRSTGAEQ